MQRVRKRIRYAGMRSRVKEGGPRRQVRANRGPPRAISLGVSLSPFISHSSSAISSLPACLPSSSCLRAAAAAAATATAAAAAATPSRAANLFKRDSTPSLRVRIPFVFGTDAPWLEKEKEREIERESNDPRNDSSPAAFYRSASFVPRPCTSTGCNLYASWKNLLQSHAWSVSLVRALSLSFGAPCALCRGT